MECGRSRAQDPRWHADELMCRACQRSPAVQMRIFLARARIQGFAFEVAWAWAWERVKWPHDTTARRDWKRVLKQPTVRGSFERAYCFRAKAPREQYIQNLELVA